MDSNHIGYYSLPKIPDEIFKQLEEYNRIISARMDCIKLHGNFGGSAKSRTATAIENTKRSASLKGW